VHASAPGQEPGDDEGAEVVVGSEIAGIACGANQQRSAKGHTRLTNKVGILEHHRLHQNIRINSPSHNIVCLMLQSLVNDSIPSPMLLSGSSKPVLVYTYWPGRNYGVSGTRFD
jgi:hypothetical protein